MPPPAGRHRRTRPPPSPRSAPQASRPAITLLVYLPRSCSQPLGFQRVAGPVPDGTGPRSRECRAGGVFHWPLAHTPAGPVRVARRRLCWCTQHRHLRPGLRRQRDLPVDPGGPAPSVALRHLAHADQRVRPGPQHHLLQRPDRGPVLLPRRLEDPPPQPPYVALMEPPVNGVPVQHVLRSVHRHGVQLALRFRRLDQRQRSKAHLPTSAPFRAQPRGLVSGQLSRQPAEGPAMTPWFPVAFRPPAFASWASCSRRGVPLPSRSAYQATSAWTRRGFHVPHIRVTTGLGALFTPRPSGAHTAGPIPPAAARPLYQGPGPITPVLHPISGAVYYEASSRVHSHSPVRPSPSPVVPGWIADLLGLLPGLRTPTGRTCDARQGGGRASSTRPELHDRHRRTSNP